MFTIVLVLIVVAAALIVVFTDFSFDAIAGWFSRKLGFSSGASGIQGSAQIRNDEVVVSLECQGADAFHLAAMMALDTNGQKLFPVPSRVGDTSLENDDEKTARQKLSQVKIAANETFELGFVRNTFVAMQFQSLAALDRNGKSWPIDMTAVRAQ